jgi:transcriptional regulator with XRE-family HTH domain
MALGLILRRLLLEKNISSKEFSESIGISNASFSNYLNDIRKPDYTTLIKMADYFNISVDHLLGREQGNSIASEPLAEYTTKKQIPLEMNTQTLYQMLERAIEEKLLYKMKYEECERSRMQLVNA